MSLREEIPQNPTQKNRDTVSDLSSGTLTPLIHPPTRKYRVLQTSQGPWSHWTDWPNMHDPPGKDPKRPGQSDLSVSDTAVK